MGNVKYVSVLSVAAFCKEVLIACVPISGSKTSGLRIPLFLLSACTYVHVFVLPTEMTLMHSKLLILIVYHELMIDAGSFCKIIRSAMKSYRLSELSQSEVDKLKTRPRIDFSSIFNMVSILFVL